MNALVAANERDRFGLAGLRQLHKLWKLSLFVVVYLEFVLEDDRFRGGSGRVRGLGLREVLNVDDALVVSLEHHAAERFQVMAGEVHHRLTVAVDDKLPLTGGSVRNIEADASLQKPWLASNDVRKCDLHVDHIHPWAGVETVVCQAEWNVKRPQPLLLRPHLPQGVQRIVVETAIDVHLNDRPTGHPRGDQSEERPSLSTHLRKLSPIDKQTRPLPGGKNLLERCLQIRSGQGCEGRI